MTTKKTDNLSWVGRYVSPKVKTLEIKSEGILCVSTELMMLYDRADVDYGFVDLGEI